MSKVTDVIAAGLRERGKPYVFGAAGPNKFDCSGLMVFIFATVGIHLPRTADEQYRWAKPVTSPAPGDLVFWVDGSGHASHVALYLGSGQVLAAPHTGALVKSEPLFEESGHTRHYGRVPGLGAGTAAVVAPVANVVTTAAGSVSGLLSDSVRGIALEGVAALAAVALIGLGAYRLAAPKIKQQSQALEAAL